MTDAYAGLLCTVLLLGVCAGMFSLLSAAQCRMRRGIVGYGLTTILNFALLAVLLADLPNCESLSPAPWTAALTVPLLNLSLMAVQLCRSRRRLSQVSIKESCDHLPCALCFARENGHPSLKNLKMDELSHRMMGEALLNANAFWKKLEAQPIVTLENGQTWSFERTELQLDGKKVYQIVGTDVTEESSLNRELETDNRRLTDMNRRLRQYGQNVQTVTREREILCAKTRIHDEIGRVLLQTRQFLSAGQGNAVEIREAWRQNIRLLMGAASDVRASNAGEALNRAAQAIGVTMERIGVFPAEGTENALLAAAAARECLTNLVRHAKGKRLQIHGTERENAWVIAYLNDGIVPTAPIVEGSGLSALRARTEAAGGVMTVEHAPRFCLTLTLPKERRETK